MNFKFLIITIFTGSAARTVSCGYSGGSNSYNGGYNNVQSYGGSSNGGVPSGKNNNIIGN